MSNLVEAARIFAENAHSGQLRKYTGAPYFSHCQAVADLVREKGGNDEQIAAALLHDTIEDCNVTAQEITEQFGATVAGYVMNSRTNSRTKRTRI